MAGLADAFRARWPAQPQMLDPVMPVPQTGPQLLDPRMLLQRPLNVQEAPQQGFFSPDFADFLRNYYFGQRRL